MKYLLTCFAALAFCSVSQAAQIQCNGSLFGYNINVHTSTNKGVVAGDIVVIISSGSSVVKTSTLKVTSSQIVPNQSIDVTGSGPDGSGTFKATYNSSTGTYNGTMDAQTSIGDLQADLICSVQGLMTDDGLRF